MKEGMLSQVRQRNNEFWESVRTHHLEGFLKSAYSDPRRSALIKRWLHGNGCRRVAISQSDFDSDPLVIVFWPHGFEIKLGRGGPGPEAEVEVEFTHLDLIASSTSLGAFFRAWIMGRIKVKNTPTRARDLFYVARIFLVG